MENCLFCKIVNGEVPSWKVHEDTDVVAFLDIHPVNIGHVVIIPRQHFENLYDTPDEVLQKMIVVIKKISVAVKRAANADGINIEMNNDSAAGQVIFHTHIHVVPRYENDGFTHWKGKRPYEEGEKEAVAENIRAALM
jgi:histidine triad (HIT) family protein